MMSACFRNVRVAGIFGLLLAGWIAGSGYAGCGVAAANTWNVPPVMVNSLAHERRFDGTETYVSDVVYIPTGGGTYTNGQGFTAAIGTGDTVIVRLQASTGQQFNITPGPGADATTFQFDFLWTAGADSSGNNPTPTITFENFQGVAMTNTYRLTYVGNAGRSIRVTMIFDVNGPCAFSAVQLAFPVTHALGSTSRTYGLVQTFSSPAIYAGSRYSGNFPSSPIIMALGTLSLPGACCNGALCTVTLPLNCTGGTAVHLGQNVACNPTVRGGTVNACCPSDFNNSGTVSVQDIFDFLAAYFAGC